MKTKRFISFGSAVLLSLGSLLAINLGHAFAATITWTGGGVDGNWSTAANWQGGVAPTNGDSVVIDNAATFTNGSTDDIVGLSLANITFINNAAGGTVSIVLGQNLTVTTAITQAASANTTSEIIGSTSGNGSKILTLGGDVTVTVAGGYIFGDLNQTDTLALGTHTLTFLESAAGGIVGIDANITGTGGIVYNASGTDFQLRGNNTYSGPTHIMASTLPVHNTGTNNNAFGTSAITIDNGGSIDFTYTTNTTISNAITVAGTANGSPVTSVGFNNSGTTATITIPNITLNGNTRFSNNSLNSTPLTVNLAGITANGHCIEYLGYGNDATSGPANGFTNGPASCVIAATTNDPAPAPKAPNTGFALIRNNPIATFVITALAAAGIVLIARRYNTAASKK